MIKEHFKISFTKAGKKERSSVERFVEITGKDLPRFADVLLRQAAEARKEGKVGEADRFERLSARVRKARKFSCRIPTDGIPTTSP